MSQFAGKVTGIAIDRDKQELTLMLTGFRKLRIYNVDVNPSGESAATFDMESAGFWNIDVVKLMANHDTEVIQYVLAAVQSAFGEPADHISL